MTTLLDMRLPTGLPSIIGALILAATSATPLLGDDWNFKPDEYHGQDLSFDGDSDWFPKELKENLKETLKHVLEKRTTGGVNTTDFYHGHIVCPKPCTECLLDARRQYEARLKVDNAYVNGWNAANLSNARVAVTAEKQLLAKLLNHVLKHGCGVVYHTYETASTRPPGMGVNDPRRNIFTPIGGKPEEFTPPTNPANGTTYEGDDNYQNKYCKLFEFSFLVDEHSKIHVVPDSFTRLVVVTGL